MDGENDRFENFLREFEPHQPRALPCAEQTATANRARRATAGAIALLGLAASIWLALTRPAQRSEGVGEKRAESLEAPTMPLSALSLRRLAAADPEKLDAVLDAAARRSLPDFRRPDSSLHALTKE